MDDIFADIASAACDWPGALRVFLADGDAMGLATNDLKVILIKLAQTFPNLQRVTCYATPVNLLKKSAGELEQLRALQLSLIYVGVESGSLETLKRITKGASPASMEKALGKARGADIKVSATVILGLGGRDMWREHIEGTAALINKTAPTYLLTLQLGLEESQKDRFMQRFERFGGKFQWQDDQATLEELRHLLSKLDPVRPVIFRSNHASNALALAGNLPKDKPRLLAEVNSAVNGETALREPYIRGF